MNSERKNDGSRTLPEDLAIRPLAAGDIAAVVGIALAAWEPIYAQYLRDMGPDLFRHLFGDDWRAGKAHEVESRARAEPEAFLVAEANSTVVGFVSWRLDRKQRMGEVMNNAVHPDWQGRGIAGALYDATLRVFRSEGLQFAFVETGGDPAHAPAVRAYQKSGFAIREDIVKLYREL